EEARAHARLRPGVPVAHEGLVIDPARAVVRCRAGDVGAAHILTGHVAVRPDHHSAAVRCDQETADSVGDIGDLLGRLATADTPYLIAARFAGQEVNPLAVRGKDRGRFVDIR